MSDSKSTDESAADKKTSGKGASQDGDGPSAAEIAEALGSSNDNEPLLSESDLQDQDGEGALDPFAVLEKLQAENEDLKAQLLRLAADMENLRKRTDREKSEASKYAASSFARDIIAVADNIGRAVKAVPDEELASNEAVKKLLDGVQMTERELLNVFRRHGIERLEPEGEKFDPNFHDAVYEIENKDVPAGTVLQVAQEGYRIAERVLRPAMVGVAKGGPKCAPAPAESGPEES